MPGSRKAVVARPVKKLDMVMFEPATARDACTVPRDSSPWCADDVPFLHYFLLAVVLPHGVPHYSVPPPLFSMVRHVSALNEACCTICPCCSLTVFCGCAVLYRHVCINQASNTASMSSGCPVGRACCVCRLSRSPNACTVINTLNFHASFCHRPLPGC
jgi:hypothetical protein